MQGNLHQTGFQMLQITDYDQKPDIPSDSDIRYQIRREVSYLTHVKILVKTALN